MVRCHRQLGKPVREVCGFVDRLGWGEVIGIARCRNRLKCCGCLMESCMHRSCWAGVRVARSSETNLDNSREVPGLIHDPQITRVSGGGPGRTRAGYLCLQIFWPSCRCRKLSSTNMNRPQAIKIESGRVGNLCYKYLMHGCNLRGNFPSLPSF